MMKTVLLVMSLFLSAVAFQNVDAQENLAARPSPPAVARGQVGDAALVINYSQPAVKGRVIWGELVPYGKVWRTGANEATVFETNADIMIAGKTLPAGKYGLFTIPGEKEWTLIFNSEWDQWGAYKYDAAKDVLRVTAVPAKSLSFNERMQFEVSDGNVVLLWENLQVTVPVKS